MPEKEKPRTTLKATRACGEWLLACLDLGWKREQLDFLEALWWKYHNERGELIASPPQEPR